MLFKHQRLYLVSGFIVFILIVLHLVPSLSPLSLLAPIPRIAATTTPYIDPQQLTRLKFGYQSHWLQPWRAYLETVPATTFLEGLGMVFKVKSPTNPELVAQMLAKHGIRNARFVINWGELDYDTETKFDKNEEFRHRLLALQNYGIRPLIVLNAHQGNPCPSQSFKRIVTTNAVAGSTTIELNDISDIKPGYSGLSNLTQFWAAEVLITDISSHYVSLSKPLSHTIKAGTPVTIHTLKYRPFSSLNSQDYQQTMAGWLHYVHTVAKFAVEVLDTGNKPDKGFDLEIWNELSFGSNFLKIDKYYNHELNTNKTHLSKNKLAKNKQPILVQDQQNEEELDDEQDNASTIRDSIVYATTHYADNHPELFEGVAFTNGFASTIPWPASSLQPARIKALSKHPYPKLRHYPQDENKGKPMNALYQLEDKSAFVPPTYSVLFPEYSATALHSSIIVRDMGLIPSKINGIQHGRNARVINGVVIPTPVWITEANINPSRYNLGLSEEKASIIQAKTNARYVCFFLNKGVSRIYLFAAGKEDGWDLIKHNFLDYAKTRNTQYPTDDTIYTSPTLITLGRIVNKMSEQLDPNLKHIRQINVVSVSDMHNHDQFTGDGTPAHPNLYNRDVFVVLPFQVNEHRFIIPYYVMTRDVMKDLSPEQFTVKFQGINGTNASFSVYDPIQNKPVLVQINERNSQGVSVTLTATDYPYLLIVDETA